MHVDRLNCDERAHGVCVLENDLENQPRIDKSVVGIYQNSGAAGPFAPARQSLQVAIRSHRGGRICSEYLNLRSVLTVRLEDAASTAQCVFMLLPS